MPAANPLETPLWVPPGWGALSACARFHPPLASSPGESDNHGVALDLVRYVIRCLPRVAILDWSTRDNDVDRLVGLFTMINDPDTGEAALRHLEIQSGFPRGLCRPRSPHRSPFEPMC